MRFSEMMQKTKKITVSYQGDSVTVMYRLNVVTDTFIEQLDGMDTQESMNSQLMDAVVSWDIVDDAGKPIAPSPEFLKKLPRSFKMAVLQTIVADMQAPGEAEKKS